MNDYHLKQFGWIPQVLDCFFFGLQPCQDTIAEKIYSEIEQLWCKDDKYELVRDAFSKCRDCKKWLYVNKRSSLRADDVQGCMNVGCTSHRPGKKSKGFMKALNDSGMLVEEF